jgi:hypothetical protein
VKKICEISGLSLLSKTGSLIFCEKCEKIIGSINKSGYKYINIVLTCSCGNFGAIEISKNGRSYRQEKVDKTPNERSGVAVCKNCDTAIFGIIDWRVQNYSFFAECKCGEKYDTRCAIEKRLGETARLLKIKNLKNK